MRGRYQRNQEKSNIQYLTPGCFDSFLFVSCHQRCLFHPFEYRNKLIYL